jgi:hypothetical protein
MVKIKEDLIKQITDQLKEMQFGSLLITVHNNEVTQLDVTRKQRFDQTASLSKPRY